MTQRLFFTDDALNCDVDVTHCVPHEDGFAVTLAATPFHPQGGGQPSDTGWIGDSQVTRVMQEQESIVHYTTHPVATGKAQPLEAEAVQHALAQWISADLARHVHLATQQRAVSFGELPGYPCGGTHVRSLAELGAVNVLSVSQKKGVLSVRYTLD